MATLGRHSETESFALHTWVPRVFYGYVALVLMIGGLTLGWMLIGPDSDSPPKSDSVSGSLARGKAPAGSGPGNVPDNNPDKDPASAQENQDAVLVANAKKVKPLEDLRKGDRVIYRGRVCTWQQWGKSINTSTVKCAGRTRFQTQTARLTPVELKG